MFGELTLPTGLISMSDVTDLIIPLAVTAVAAGLGMWVIPKAIRAVKGWFGAAAGGK